MHMDLEVRSLPLPRLQQPSKLFPLRSSDSLRSRSIASSPCPRLCSIPASATLRLTQQKYCSALRPFHRVFPIFKSIGTTSWKNMVREPKCLFSNYSALSQVLGHLSGL